MRDNEMLIKSLAANFGLQDTNISKYDGSRYDPSTGTFYCEGLTITKSMVLKALDYFERQKESQKTLATHDSSLMDQYLINVVAYNAIQMLVTNIKKD